MSFADLVRDHPDFEILEESERKSCRFRYVPHRFCELQDEPTIRSRLDRLNRALAHEARRLGIEAVDVAGRIALSPSPEADDNVNEAFEALVRMGHQLAQKESW
jgi:hypothetical protein